MKVFLLYDERANYDLDKALVLDTAETLREARRSKERLFPEAVIYQYDEENGKLRNGKRVA